MTKLHFIKNRGCALCGRRVGGNPHDAGFQYGRYYYHHRCVQRLAEKNRAIMDADVLDMFSGETTTGAK